MHHQRPEPSVIECNDGLKDSIACPRTLRTIRLVGKAGEVLPCMCVHCAGNGLLTFRVLAGQPGDKAASCRGMLHESEIRLADRRTVPQVKHVRLAELAP